VAAASLEEALRKPTGLGAKFLLLALTVLYLFSLEYVYLNLIAPRYEYMGLRSGHLTLTEYAISFLLSVSTAFFVPTTVKRPASGLLIFLYFTVVLPTFLFPFHLAPDNAPSPTPMMFAQAVGFVLAALIARAKPITFRPFKPGRTVAFTLLIATGILTLVLRLIVFREIEFDLNLYEVYSRRLEGRTLTGERNFVAYALNVGTSGVGLLMVGIGISKRYYGLFIFGIVLYFIAFLTVGNKDAIFIPLLIVTTVLMLRFLPRQFVPAIILALIALCWASVLEVRYRETYELSAVVIRRQLIFPAAGTYSYWQYFSSNPLYYWSDSFLRWIVPCPYPVSKSFWMGQMAGSSTLSANVNIWGSAFADAGYLGMALVSVALGYMCRILDGLTMKHGVLIGLLVAFGLAAKFSNTSFERVTVTHGGIAIFFFLYLLQPITKRTLQAAPGPIPEGPPALVPPQFRS
jgi:hypothetical protein